MARWERPLDLVMRRPGHQPLISHSVHREIPASEPGPGFCGEGWELDPSIVPEQTGLVMRTQSPRGFCGLLVGVGWWLWCGKTKSHLLALSVIPWWLMLCLNVHRFKPPVAKVPPGFARWRSQNFSLLKSESRSVLSDSLRTRGLYSPWNSPGQNTGMGSLLFPSPGDLPNPGIEPRSPMLQADSLPAELSGKPRS